MSDVAALLEGSSNAKQRLFWRDLIDGQMDADRMDYLLRDSLYAGVSYGHFDLSRIIATIRIAKSETGEPVWALQSGGAYIAEQMLLARFFMFLQVYFHKTRRILDIHLRDFLSDWLPRGAFPYALGSYLRLTDESIVSDLLTDKRYDRHRSRILGRNHLRMVAPGFEKSDFPEGEAKASTRIKLPI